MARFNDDLDILEQATYVGGTGRDESMWHGLALGYDSSGFKQLFLAGETESSDFPAVLYTDDNSTAQPVFAGVNRCVCSAVESNSSHGEGHRILNCSHDIMILAIILSIRTSSLADSRIENMGGSTLSVSDIFLTGADVGDYTLDFITGATACGDNHTIVGALV